MPPALFLQVLPHLPPSRTVPQGIAALINFLPDLSPEENLENMTSEMGRIHTGQITYAVRNTNIDGMEILMEQFNNGELDEVYVVHDALDRRI